MKVNKLIEELQAGDLTIRPSRTYIPYSEKLVMIENILSVLTYEENGIVTYNTNHIQFHSTLSFIKGYYDIQIDDINNDYDTLAENLMLSILIDAVEEDYAILVRMLDNMLEDMLREKNSMEAVVNRGLMGLSESVTSALSGIVSLVSNLDLTTIMNDLGKLSSTEN